jgi:phage gp36-like protein
MYATAADFRDRYPERDLQHLTDPDGLTVQDAVLERAAAQASSIIDGYIGARYPLPLAVVPPILAEYTVDIGIYRLQVLRPQNDVEDARKRYEDAITYLKLVTKGDADLPGQTSAGGGDGDGVAGGDGAAVDKRPPLFGGVW